MKDWFTVDKEGLAKVLGRRDKAFAVMELIQNAWDADGVSLVEVTMKPDSAGKTLLVVEEFADEGRALVGDLRGGSASLAPPAGMLPML